MMKKDFDTKGVKRKPADDETIRRIRLGDIQRILRHRYRNNGCVLTDDDAGRDDLYQLLLPISLGQGHVRKMENAIQIWAPWMSAHEASELIDNINRTPDSVRKPNKRILGERMNLPSCERDALGVRTIAPVDMTDEQLEERRKAKDAERKWRKRRAAKMKPREAWLVNCLSRTQPWKKAGVSRRTWERRRAKQRTKVSQVGVAGVSAIKLNTVADRLASVESQKRKRKSRKRVAAGRRVA